MFVYIILIIKSYKSGKCCLHYENDYPGQKRCFAQTKLDMLILNLYSELLQHIKCLRYVHNIFLFKENNINSILVSWKCSVLGDLHDLGQTAKLCKTVSCQRRDLGFVCGLPSPTFRSRRKVFHRETSCSLHYLASLSAWVWRLAALNVDILICTRLRPIHIVDG